MKITHKLLKEMYKKLQKIAIPKTIDGKYWIVDDKTREEYNKKIKQEVNNVRKP